TLGIEVIPFEIRRSEDIAPAFEKLSGHAEAVYVVGDPLMNANRMRINVLALTARLPTIYSQREYLDAGGLMSYAPNYLDLNRRAADLVDKILRGRKAGRPPGRAAHQIRFDHQPGHRQVAWDRNTGDAARPRRRGDRIAVLLLRRASKRAE